MKKYKINDIVTCEISGITDYGIFVKVDNDYSGLIHISEISDKFVSNINSLYIKGDILDAKVIEIDSEKKQLKLSIKFNEKSKNKNKLTEKGKGFEPLKEKLDIWVKEKMEELGKLEKTK